MTTYNVDFTDHISNNEWPTMLNVTSFTEAESDLLAIAIAHDASGVTLIEYDSLTLGGNPTTKNFGEATLWYDADNLQPNRLLGVKIDAANGWDPPPSPLSTRNTFSVLIANPLSSLQ